MISATRALIWSLSKGDTTLIEKAKAGVKLADPELYWAAVLRNVEEAVKPRKRRKPKQDPTTQESKDRYRKAKWDYELNKFFHWVNDKHFIEPDYPDCGTKKGLDDFICNFLKWNGHFENPTNNKGFPVDKTAPKMNIHTGNVEQVVTGEKQWRRSGANKGMQDIDCNLNHPDHEWGIAWKIETKTATDYQSKDQKKFEAKVKATSGHYSIVKSAEDFLAQYDQLMVRKVKQKELFS